MLYQGEKTVYRNLQTDLAWVETENGSRWETVYHDFPATGDWRVIYEIQDLEGFWSLPGVGRVRVEEIIPPCATPPCVSARFDQNVYRTGQALQFDLETHGQTTYDVYAAILFPHGSFVTFRHSREPSLPYTIFPWREAVLLRDTNYFPILQFDALPQGLPLGQYQGCGGLLTAGDDPWKGKWAALDCVGFRVE